MKTGYRFLDSHCIRAGCARNGSPKLPQIKVATGDVAVFSCVATLFLRFAVAGEQKMETGYHLASREFEREL